MIDNGYVRGNVAVAPKRKIEEEVKKRREIKRSPKKQKEKNIFSKDMVRITIAIIVLISILSGGILFLNSKIYEKQKEVSNLDILIDAEMDISEAIKVDLLKISAIDNVNTIAKDKLKMAYPEKQDIIEIDMSKEYFKHLKEK